MGTAPAGTRCPSRCHRNGLTSHLPMPNLLGWGLGEESISCQSADHASICPGVLGDGCVHCEWGQWEKPREGVTKGCPQEREGPGDAPG